MNELVPLLESVRACRRCEPHLPLGPRPVFQLAKTARLLIIGQAPGRQVHESGVPWNDNSGTRLRSWMGVEPSTFYDEAQVAILPIGLCYPGADASGGDRPPRPECAPHWHHQLLAHLPNVEVTLLVGQYAHHFYLRDRRKSSLTETVRAFREYGPQMIPLPHPSWRSVIWTRKNPWFEAEVIPYLQDSVRAATGPCGAPC